MPSPRYLHTSDLAKAVGVHPNTIRLYEVWSFLPPVPRNASGYRLFSQAHLDQMRLARLALHGGWPGRNIRQSALALVKKRLQAIWAAPSKLPTLTLRWCKPKAPRPKWRPLI